MKKFYLYTNTPKELSSNSHSCAPLPKIKNKKIIAFSPHADDLAIACGGTLTLLSAHNTIVPILCFTGHRGVHVNREEAIALREQEMTSESKILGITSPIFLRLDSYEREDQATITKDTTRIADELIKQNPDIIFLPWHRDSQPRHRLASIMTQAALEQASLAQAALEQTTLFFYETTWRQFGALDFNCGFVINDDIMDTKIRAIRAHQSQLQRTAFDEAAQHLARLRAITVPEQRIGGYGHDTPQIHIPYLEVFLSLDTSAYALRASSDTPTSLCELRRVFDRDERRRKKFKKNRSS